MATTQNLTELPSIQYTGMDYQSVISQIQEIISNNPNWKENWTDFYDSEAGTMLVQLMAWICDNLAIRQDMMYNEQFLATASSNQSKLRLLNQIGYKQRTTSSSIVKIEVVPTSMSSSKIKFSNNYTSLSNIKDTILKFTAKDINGRNTSWEVLDVNSDGSINYLTKIILNAYQSLYTNYVDGNTTKTLYAVQGETTHIEQTSSTADGPVFDLGVSDLDLKTLSVFEETDDSIIIHTKIDSFIDLSEVDDNVPCYIVEKNDNGNWQIRYAWESIVENNAKLEGHQFVAGSKIHIFFRTSNGSTGNIAEGIMNYSGTAINENNGQIGYSISNIAAGYNGKDGETLTEAVKNAPLSIMTMNRAVTTDDFDRILKNNDLVANCISYSPSNMPENFKSWYGRRINPQEIFTFITLNKNIDDIPTSKLNYFPWIDLVKTPVLNEQYSMFNGAENSLLENSELNASLYVNDVEYNEQKDYSNFIGIKNRKNTLAGKKLLRNSVIYETVEDIKTQIAAGNENIKIKCHTSSETNPYLDDIYSTFTESYDSLTVENNLLEKDAAATYYSNSLSSDCIDCGSVDTFTIVIDDNLEFEVDLKKELKETIIEEATNIANITFTEDDFDSYYLKLDNETSFTMDLIDDYDDLEEEELLNILKGETGAEYRKGIVQLIREAYEELVNTTSVDGDQELAKQLSRTFYFDNNKYTYGDLGYKFPSNILSYSYDNISEEEAEEYQSNTNPFYKNYKNSSRNGVTNNYNDDEYYALKINGNIYAFKINPYTINKAIEFYEKYKTDNDGNSVYCDVYNYIGLGNTYKIGDKTYSFSMLEDLTAKFANGSATNYTDAIVYNSSIVEYITLTPDRFAAYLEYVFSPLNEDEILKTFTYNSSTGKYDLSNNSDDLGLKFSLVEKDYYSSNSEFDNEYYSYDDGKCYDIRFDYLKPSGSVKTNISDGDLTITSLSKGELTTLNNDSIEVKDFFEEMFGVKRNISESTFDDFDPEDIINIVILSDGSGNALWIRSLKKGPSASLYFKADNSTLGVISLLGLDTDISLANSNSSDATYLSNKAFGYEALELYTGETIDDIISLGDIIYTSNNLNYTPDSMYISYILDSTNKQLELNKQENYYSTDDSEAPNIIGISGQVVKYDEDSGEYVIDKVLSDFDVRLTSEEFDGYSFYNIEEDNLNSPILNVIKNKKTYITTTNFNLADATEDGITLVDKDFRVVIEGIELDIAYSDFNNPNELTSKLINAASSSSTLKDYANIIAEHRYSNDGVTISGLSNNVGLEFKAEDDVETSLFKYIFGTNKTNSDLYTLYPISAIKTINGENTDVIHYVDDDQEEYYYAPTSSSSLNFVYREFDDTSDEGSRFGDYYISCSGDRFGNYSFYLNKTEYSENFPDGNIYVHFINDRTYSEDADEIEENVLKDYMKKYMIAGTEINFLKPYFRTFDIQLKVIYNPNYNESDLRTKIKEALEDKFKITNLDSISTGGNIYRSDIEKIVLNIDGVIAINLKYFGYDKNDTENYPSQIFALTDSTDGTSEDGTDFYIINVLGDFSDSDLELEKSGSLSINN